MDSIKSFFCMPLKIADSHELVENRKGEPTPTDQRVKKTPHPVNDIGNGGESKTPTIFASRKLPIPDDSNIEGTSASDSPRLGGHETPRFVTDWDVLRRGDGSRKALSQLPRNGDMSVDPYVVSIPQNQKKNDETFGDL